MNGNCVSVTGSPVPLLDPYVVSVKTINEVNSSGFTHVRKNSSAITAEYSVFLDDAYSSLDLVLGYEGCTVALPPSPVVPTLANPLWRNTASVEQYLASATASATASSTTRSAKSSVSVQHVHTTQIIVVSVITPIAGLMVFLLCFIAIRRYRKKRSQAVIISQLDTTTDTQLYVDRKAELEDEERRKYELDAAGISYEMEGEDRIFEMPSGGDPDMRLASSQETQELRGVEHSRELEVPGNVS